MCGGGWLRDAGWRGFLLSCAGGMLWLFGGFGIGFVLGPPAVKLIIGVVLIYVFTRFAWAFWQA